MQLLFVISGAFATWSILQHNHCFGFYGFVIYVSVNCFLYAISSKIWPEDSNW